MIAARSDPSLATPSRGGSRCGTGRHTDSQCSYRQGNPHANYGWPQSLDHEMGKIRCIQANAAAGTRSTRTPERPECKTSYARAERLSAAQRRPGPRNKPSAPPRAPQPKEPATSPQHHHGPLRPRCSPQSSSAPATRVSIAANVPKRDISGGVSATSGPVHERWHSQGGRCGGSPPARGRAGTARPPRKAVIRDS